MRAGSVFFRVAVDATDQEENRADGLRTFTTVGRLDGLGRSVVFSFARVEDVSCVERLVARGERGEKRARIWSIDQRCFRWDRVKVCYTGIRGEGYIRVSRMLGNSRCTHSLFA